MYGFFTTHVENKFRDQELEISIFVPEGTVIFPEENTISYYSSSDFNELSNWDNQAHYYRIQNNTIECLDCSEKTILKNPNPQEELNSENEMDSLKSNQTKSWEQEVINGLKNKDKS